MFDGFGVLDGWGCGGGVGVSAISVPGGVEELVGAGRGGTGGLGLVVPA